MVGVRAETVQQTPQSKLFMAEVNRCIKQKQKQKKRETIDMKKNVNLPSHPHNQHNENKQ